MSDTMHDMFEAHFKSLDLSTEQDSWGVPQYKHSHVDALWTGWQAAQSQPAPLAPQSVQEIMRLMGPYIEACVKFNNAHRGIIDDALVEAEDAFKPLEAALTALVEKNHELQFSLDGVNAMRRPEWISVDERLPAPGMIVLAFFRNSHGRARTIRAHHAPKHTIEAAHWDDDCEVDETEDGTFEPEGWYEDPAVGETLFPIRDGLVTYWQPMPPPPIPGIEPEQGESHAK